MFEFPDFSVEGFAGQSNQKEYAELIKALSTGQTYGLTDQTGGAALRLESLQATLKTATFQEQSAVMWRMIPKVKAYSTVEEYALQHEVGDAEFYVEGGLPQEFDTVYERRFEIVKFLGAVGKVSNPAQAVRNLMDLKAQETLNRTLGIIRKANKTLYFGNASVNSYEFTGIFEQIRTRGTTDHIIDMEGKRIRLEEINKAATIILDNYGIPNRLFMSPQAKQYYVDELIASKTYFINDESVNRIGINPNRWQVANGEGDVVTDVFLRTMDPGSPYKNQAGNWIKQPGKPPSAATSSKAPSTPEIGSVTTPPDTSGVTKWLSGDAGDYDYKFTAVNQYGESAPDEETSVTVAAGDKVVIPVTEGGGAYAATGYKVYRKLSAAASTEYKFAFQVAYSASPQDVEDYNLYRPGTTMAFMLDFNPQQVIAYHQLLPFFSMPLAVIDDSIRWLCKLYGVLMVYNPLKIVVIKNIGPTAHS